MQAKLELYGLYKQATDGPCTVARPAIWNLRARSKWCATRIPYLHEGNHTPLDSSGSCAARSSCDRSMMVITCSSARRSLWLTRM